MNGAILRNTTGLFLLVAALTALNPDEMSPREALEALYRLKTQAAQKKQ